MAAAVGCAIGDVVVVIVTACVALIERTRPGRIERENASRSPDVAETSGTILDSCITRASVCATCQAAVDYSWS